LKTPRIEKLDKELKDISCDIVLQDKGDDDTEFYCEICHVTIAYIKANKFSNVYRHLRSATHAINAANLKDDKSRKENFEKIDKKYPSTFYRQGDLYVVCRCCQKKMLLDGKNLMANVAAHVMSTTHVNKMSSVTTKLLTDYFTKSTKTEQQDADSQEPQI
jgi:hypothetical protein